MKIPIVRPWFDEAEEQAVVDVLRSGWVGQGTRVGEFENQIAALVGSKHAVAVSSCTAALHIASLAAGFGPDDEVLVPAFTWISTPNAVELTGATPVFCDIDPTTFNIDVEKARQRMTSRTRGIIPVHLFGLAADMKAILDFNLTTIEDAACALGTTYCNRQVGPFGKIGCFSFHPRKSITTGEGGILVTDDQQLYDTLLRLRNIGSDGKTGDFPLLGFNYRMTDLQAAIGLAQLRKLPEILRRRRECAAAYDRLLTDSRVSKWLNIPAASALSNHSYQSYVCKIKAANWQTEAFSTARNALIQRLGSDGIESRPGTHAPVLLTYYRKKYGLRPEDFPAAADAHHLTLALPLFPQLTAPEQEWICSRLQYHWERVVRS